MLRIEAIPNKASPLAEQARTLFRLYYDFLQSAKAAEPICRCEDNLTCLELPLTGE